MEAGLSSAQTLKPITCLPTSLPSILHSCNLVGYCYRARRKALLSTICFVLGEKRQIPSVVSDDSLVGESPREMEHDERSESIARSEERIARKMSESFTYLVAAVMPSFGITSMTALAVYYRFSWQMEVGIDSRCFRFLITNQAPHIDRAWWLCFWSVGRRSARIGSEMFGTFALSVGAAVGIEFWARWAHRALWHASPWHMDERDGPFDLNDVSAIINALPEIALLSYGFFHKDLVPGLCVSAGLGITVFGIAYMFVHDIANVPYLRDVAAAHQLHHSDKFNGIPYGLFLGPKEYEKVGVGNKLAKEIIQRLSSSLI